MFCVNRPTNERADGQNDERTNKRMFRIGVATDSSRGSACRVVLYAVAYKGERLGIEFGVQQIKNSFLILRDAIAALLACAAVARPPFRVQQQTKEATPPSTYLIVSESDDPDLDGVTFCCAAIVSSGPALICFCP